MFAIVSILLLVLAHVFAAHDDEYCLPITVVELCPWSFGCYWNSQLNKCTEQEYYLEDTGTCAGLDTPFPDDYGYDCFDDGTTYYIYDLSSYDPCSGAEYTSPTGQECPANAEGAVCHQLPYSDNPSALGCYEYPCEPGSADPLCSGCTDLYAPGCPCDANPWEPGCYSIKTNAGICEGRSVSGCSGIPFCDWNSSCQPDWKCYYTYWNNGKICNPGCKNKVIAPDAYCTTDTITSDEEKCIVAKADKETCEAAGCEWVPSGSTTAAGSYTSWCAKPGSGAYVTRISSVLMVLLSIMFTFL